MILVVHSLSFRWYIVDLIRKIHGRDYPVKTLKIMSPHQYICGYDWPVLIDHFVWDYASSQSHESDYNRGLTRIIEYIEWQKKPYRKAASSRSSQIETHLKSPVKTLTSRTHRWIRSSWEQTS